MRTKTLVIIMVNLLIIISIIFPTLATVGDTFRLVQTATALPPMTTTPITEGQDYPVYRVQFVDRNFALLLQSGPSITSSTIGTINNGDDLQAMGNPTPEENELADQDTLWVPVQTMYEQPPRTGWVNRLYIVPQVDPSIYCADPKLRGIVDEVIEAVRIEDGERLAKVVTPQRGLYIGGYHWRKMIHLLPNQVPHFFTDPTVWDWGQEEYGELIQGTISDVIVPLLKDFLLPSNVTSACYDIQDGTVGAGIFRPSINITSLPFYSVLGPGKTGGLDWGTWVFGFDYWQGVPTLSVLSYNFWTP